MYQFVNVPQPTTAGVGTGTPKDPNVTIMRAQDIAVFPPTDSKGVLLAGNFVMKSGKTAVQVYMTGVNQDATYETDGEVDEEGVMQKFVATHPGDELEAHEFFQNNLGKDLIIIYGTCSDTRTRVYGTKCSPMRLKAAFQSNKDKTGFTFTFDQIQKTRFVPGFYAGSLPVVAPIATDESVVLAAANAVQQYKLNALETTAAVSITSTDLPHGTLVTFIGSGGGDPATLSSGDLTGATAILKDNAQWVALDGATITFEVFDADATVYLIEKSRT